MNFLDNVQQLPPSPQSTSKINYPTTNRSSVSPRSANSPRRSRQSRYGSQFPAGIISKPLKINRRVSRNYNSSPHVFKIPSSPRREKENEIESSSTFWSPGVRNHSQALHKLHPPPNISIPKPLYKPSGATSAGLVGGASQGWYDTEDETAKVQETKKSIKKKKKKAVIEKSIPALTLPALRDDDFLLLTLRQEIDAISNQATKKMILAPEDKRELLTIRQAVENVFEQKSPPRQSNRFLRLFCKKSNSPSISTPKLSISPLVVPTIQPNLIPLPLVFPPPRIPISIQPVLNISMNEIVSNLPYKRPHMEKKVGVNEKNSRIEEWKKGVSTSEVAVRSRSSKLVHHRSISRDYRNVIESREEEESDEEFGIENVESEGEEIVFSIAKRRQVNRRQQELPAVPPKPAHFNLPTTPRKISKPTRPAPSISLPPLPCISPDGSRFMSMLDNYYSIDNLPKHDFDHQRNSSVETDVASLGFTPPYASHNRVDSIDSSLQEIEVMAREIGGEDYCREVAGHDYLIKSIEGYPGPVIQRRSSNFTLSSIEFEDLFILEPKISEQGDRSVGRRNGVASMIRREKMEERDEESIEFEF